MRIFDVLCRRRVALTLGNIFATGGQSAIGITSVNESYDNISNTWVLAAPMITARIEMGAANIGGNAYFVGGGKSGAVFIANENERYALAANLWTSKAPIPIPTWRLCAESPSNGLLYAISGSLNTNVQDQGSNINQEYSPSTNLWTSRALLPFHRGAAAGASPGNGRLYIMGGLSDSGYVMGEHAEYTPVSNTWTARAEMSPARCLHIAVSPGNGRFYSLGGFIMSRAFEGNHEYSPDTNLWTTRANMPAARASPSGASPGNGVLYVMGGSPAWSGSQQGNCWEYSPATNLWTARAAMLTPRERHDSVSK